MADLELCAAISDAFGPSGYETEAVDVIESSLGGLAAHRDSCKHSCRMRNPEREVGKSCFFLQIASQSHFSGAFEAENNENGCISALGLK